jgi:uncharacterized protein (TIGR02246 family)
MHHSPLLLHTTALAGALALGVLAGCTDTREVTAVDSGASSSTAMEGSVGATAALNQGIASLINAWDEAWNAGDAAAYARNYTVNGELVNPLGGILDGREAIRSQHEFLFNGPFAGSTSTSEVRRTVYLGEDVRMVDLDVTLTGFAGLPPGLPEVEPGVVRTRVKLIVVRRESGWKILAEQVTPVLPVP